MSAEVSKRHGHKHTYTALVAAATAAEAIAVAAEALPKGATVLAGDAQPSGADLGWTVTLTFSGGTRRGNDPAA